MTHHLVGVAEIAEMLGVSRQRVAQLIEAYEDFPPAEVELTAGRVWSRTAIETWIAAHPDRGPGRPESKGVVAQFFGKERSVSFDRFTDRARASVVKAQEEARLLQHNYLGTEHLLLGLLAIGEGVGFDVLRSLDVSVEDIQGEVERMIGRGTTMPEGHIPFTPRAMKVLELALREALDLGHNYIGTEHILLALVREKGGVAWQALERRGLTAKGVRTATQEALAGASATRTAGGGTQQQLERLVQLGLLQDKVDELKRLIEEQISDESP